MNYSKVSTVDDLLLSPSFSKVSCNIIIVISPECNTYNVRLHRVRNANTLACRKIEIWSCKCIFLNFSAKIFGFKYVLIRYTTVMYVLRPLVYLLYAVFIHIPMLSLILFLKFSIYNRGRFFFQHFSIHQFITIIFTYFF